MYLYHYTSSNGIFGIINSCELHCSNVNFLNDPTEQKYFDNILKEVITEAPVCKNIYEILYNKSLELSLINPFENYIISFCKNKDLLPMWVQYAKGDGYNIGFNIDSIIERNRHKFSFIKKVELTYSKDDQLSNLKKYILSHKDNAEKYMRLEESKKIAQKKHDRKINKMLNIRY